MAYKVQNCAGVVLALHLSILQGAMVVAGVDTVGIPPDVQSPQTVVLTPMQVVAIAMIGEVLGESAAVAQLTSAVPGSVQAIAAVAEIATAMVAVVTSDLIAVMTAEQKAAALDALEVIISATGATPALVALQQSLG